MMKRLLPSGAIVMPQLPGMPRELRRNDWYFQGRFLQDEERRCGMLAFARNPRLLSSSNNFNAKVESKDGQQQASASSSSSSTSSPSSLLAARMVPAARLRAHVKCVDSDWQCNEVSASGEVALVPYRRPKGRWIKIQKNKTIKIEADPSVPFGDPKKVFSEKMISKGTYTKLPGQLPGTSPVLSFAVYKESTSSAAVYRRLRAKARVPESAIAVSSDRDGFGCTTQFGHALGTTSEMLPHASRHYNLRSIVFDPLRYKPMSEWESVRLSKGNYWKLLLRGVRASSVDEIAAIFSRLAVSEEKNGGGEGGSGFVNYFPLTHFSVGTVSAVDIGLAALRGDLHKACSLWLQSEAERHPSVFDFFQKYTATTDSSALPYIAEQWERAFAQSHATRRMSEFVKQLAEYHREQQQQQATTTDTDAGAALTKLFSKVPRREAYLHAPVMFLWNAMASQRLLTYGAQRVVAGDLVRVPSSGWKKIDPRRPRPPHPPLTKRDVSADVIRAAATNSNEQDDDCFLVKRVEAGEESQYSIFDVVLPVPFAILDPEQHQHRGSLMYPSHSVNRDLYAEFLTRSCGLPNDADATDAATPKLRSNVPHIDLGKSVGDTTKHDTETITTSHPLYGQKYRYLVVRPERLSVAAIQDPNSRAVLKSDLFLAQQRAPMRVELHLPNSKKGDAVSEVDFTFFPDLKHHQQQQSEGEGDGSQRSGGHQDEDDSNNKIEDAVSFDINDRIRAPAATNLSPSAKERLDEIIAYSRNNNAATATSSSVLDQPETENEKTTTATTQRDTIRSAIDKLGGNSSNYGAVTAADGSRGGGFGSYSVAVGCYLPHGSHALSMLREVCEARHIEFHDLCDVCRF